MRLRLAALLIAIVAATPFAAWAAFKPIRVLAPGLLGLHCDAQRVCVDDLGRLAEAAALRTQAVSFVTERVGRLHAVPRIVFCSTERCARSFGFTNEGAYTVGTVGAVIGPQGWQPYFVRHELIHHLQGERLGPLKAWLLKPDWLMEGMAYALSEDPRRPLPEPLESWRREFERWNADGGQVDLWRKVEAYR